uniref:Uncharacterized protein n=1 Tax=Fusarium oxysporum (strain Fo5176) TaxID=660025 RepID=A0A0D2XLE0_FUSOF
MSSKILCVIFGASGMQGGSVIRSILASPQALERIRIRGVCRDLNKPAARYLESLGVEVVAELGIEHLIFSTLLHVKEISTNSTKFPLVDMNKDFGNFVVAALLNRDLFLGKQVYAAEAYYTLDEIAAVVNRFEPIHGFKCVTREINDREFLDQGSIAGKDAYIRQVEDLDMYRFMREPGYYLDEDLNQNQGIVIEPLSSFEEFIS